MVFKGKVFRAQITPTHRCCTPGISRRRGRITVLPPAVIRPWPGCTAGELRAGRGWQSPPCLPPRCLPVPSAAAAARGWEQVPFSLAGLGAPRLRPAAELCPYFALLFSDVPFRFLETGSELPWGPPQWRQKPSLLLERCGIAPKPAHPHSLPSRQGVLLPNTQTESPALPLLWWFLRAFRAQAAQEQH